MATPSQPRSDDVRTATLLLVALSFCWGLAWPAMRIGLNELSPWTLRFFGYTIGALTLFALLRVQGRSVAIPRSSWLHVIVASFPNVVAFGLFGTFAQLSANTTRVIIINYSMPIWASLMAWLFFRERITPRVALGLALCLGGLVVLVYPVWEASLSEPIGLLLAMGCALSWAAGTIYMKWAKIKGDLLAITFWQIVVGAVVFAIGVLIFRSPITIEPLHLRTVLAVLFAGTLGTGVAYFIWFNIIGRLPTATASLGSLANPVVGVIGSIILLGETLSHSDMIGFALIFAAAACVLLPQRSRVPERA
ncbi:MAG: DMT family transporter [Pseudomonadota bacterium]